MTKFELDTFKKLLGMYREELENADEWTMLGYPISKGGLEEAKKHAKELSAFVELVDQEETK